VRRGRALPMRCLRNVASWRTTILLSQSYCARFSLVNTSTSCSMFSSEYEVAKSKKSLSRALTCIVIFALSVGHATGWTKGSIGTVKALVRLRRGLILLILQPVKEVVDNPLTMVQKRPTIEIRLTHKFSTRKNLSLSPQANPIVRKAADSAGMSLFRFGVFSPATGVGQVRGGKDRSREEG
jgi:uncharacterized membrane protein